MGPSPSPERAVDLFRELQELGHEPDSDTYTYLIRACARTRRKGQESFYGAAFDFTRQMIEAGMEPTPATIHALLEGAKRHGDLARARWLVAHMSMIGHLDNLAMSYLFQTYATYKLPRHQDTYERSEATAESAQAEPSRNVTMQAEAEQISTDFPGPMPQTTRHVQQQLVLVMANILHANHIVPSKQALDCIAHSSIPSKNDLQPELYRPVQLDTYLLNSFFLAYNAYAASFKDFFSLSSSLLDHTSVRLNGQTWRIRLEACEKASDAETSVAHARKLFEDWRKWSRKQSRQSNCQSQACWSSAIRSLSRAEQVDEAFDLVLQHYKQHPPRDLLEHAQHTAALADAAPSTLVSLASEAYPETQSSPTIPPPSCLVYEDIHILHKRLADAEDARLGRLKGILRAYRLAAQEAKNILRRQQKRNA